MLHVLKRLDILARLRNFFGLLVVPTGGAGTGVTKTEQHGETEGKEHVRSFKDLPLMTREEVYLSCFQNMDKQLTFCRFRNILRQAICG